MRCNACPAREDRRVHVVHASFPLITAAAQHRAELPAAKCYRQKLHHAIRGRIITAGRVTPHPPRKSQAETGHSIGFPRASRDAPFNGINFNGIDPTADRPIVRKMRAERVHEIGNVTTSAVIPLFLLSSPR